MGFRLIPLWDLQFGSLCCGISDSCLHDVETEIGSSLSLIDKVRKKKKKNDVCDGLEGSDKGKNKEIRKCLGRGGGELEKRGEGFRETNKFQADPFGFWFTFCFCP